MAALKYNAFIIIFLVSCVHLDQSKNISITNNIDGCFTLKADPKISTDEPINATFSLGLRNEDQDCPCKSALFKYSSYQKTESGISNLMTGHFTTIGKSTLELPIAVHSRLIFTGTPIEISVSCSKP